MIREALGWRSREASAIILLYHRVTRLDRDRWSIAVTPEHFAEQMEQLRRGASVVPLAQLDARLERKREMPTVVITFDDGYADNLHEALPVLQRFDLPATFFVTIGPIARSREFWWDDLERLVDPDATYDATWRALRDVAGSERELTLERLRATAGVDATVRPSYRPLSPDELVCLARTAHVEIGAHTMWHSRLAALSPDEQRSEIEEGCRTLAAIVGKAVESFSYPFGRSADYTAETVRLVRDAGFARACVNDAGTVQRSTDRFALPRLYVRDWDGDELAAALRVHGIRL